MGERKTNRWFYKCSEELINNYRADERKNRNQKILKTRLNPDFPQNIELFKQLFPDCKMDIYKLKEDREKTKQFEWTFTAYDNSYVGDSKNYVSNIILLEENLNEIFDIIKNNFSNYSIKKQNLHTYTVVIDRQEGEKGIWRSNRNFILRTQWPIAILSFGRYNQYGRTHKFLTKCKIYHYLFVEPFEYDLYKEWYNPEYCCLVKASDDFHLRNMGSTPMRNYILKYFGFLHERIWLLDDNIIGYDRLHRGKKNMIEDIEIFTCIEDYIMQYDNVGIVAHNQHSEVRDGGVRNIMCKNGKCYSSMLIPTNLDFRFKHRHQEDNFISIESVCKGYTNLSFNHICYNKNTSGEDEGGNTKFIYKKEQDDIGRKERFDYSFETAKKLIESGEIILKEGRTVDNFILHKPRKHEYWHCEFQYNELKNYDINDIIKKDKIKPTTYIDTLYLDKGKQKTDKLSYKIVIPSYDRVDTLKNKTLKMLDKQGIDKKLIYIFVANDDEYNKYKKEFNDYNIIKGVIGLLPQIKFIENYFKEGDYLVRIEDDLEQIFKKIHSKKDYPSKITRKQLAETKEINLNDFIIEGFKLLEKNKLNLFGLNKTSNAFMMGDGYSTDLRLIEGCFNGFINKKYKLKVCNDSNYTLEDLERTIVFYENDGGVLRFNDVGYISNYGADGGVKSNVENRDLKIKENTKKLNDVYGKYGSLKPNKRQNGEWFELKRKPKI